MAHECAINGGKHSSLGSTCISSYMFDISILDRYFAQATLWCICSQLGKGVTSFSMLSLCLCPLMMVWSFTPSFLKMQNIGAAWKTFVSSHHPAFLYVWILLINWVLRDSGHQVSGNYITYSHLWWEFYDLPLVREVSAMEHQWGYQLLPPPTSYKVQGDLHLPSLIH